MYHKSKAALLCTHYVSGQTKLHLCYTIGKAARLGIDYHAVKLEHTFKLTGL